MAFLSGGAQLHRRLDRDDLVPVRSEPGGVPSAAGTHVEDAAGGLRKQIEHRRVYLIEREALELGHDRARSDVVAGHDIANAESVVPAVGP